MRVREGPKKVRRGSRESQIRVQRVSEKVQKVRREGPERVMRGSKESQETVQRESERLKRVRGGSR